MEDGSYITSLNLINNQINYWFEMITSPIGVCLNLISMYIFSRPSLNKTNMGFFYLNITFWNVIVLLFSFFLINSKITLGYDLSITSDTACALVWFIRRVTRLFPPWIEVLVTFDRYLFIFYTNRFNFIRVKRNISYIIIGIFVLLLFQSIPNLFFRTSESKDIENQSNGSYIVIKCSGSKNLSIVSDTISLFIKTIIPSLIMLILSLIIIKKIKNQKKKLKYKSNRDTRTFKEIQFTISIIGMNMVFLVLNLPLSIMNPVKSLYNYLNEQNEKDSLASSINLIYTITFQISNLYYSTMFFSFLIFNKIFHRRYC